ncbi:MAG TPA: DUF6152 family protein [Gammaproteobacteria bacterium]|nr:DUF6152 family protein [Gammaproteobacteria bacterium]
MTSVSRFVFAAAVVAGSIAGAAYAHHSYAAFDRCKPVALEGEINKVEWVNPHIVIDLRTKDVSNYRIEWFALGQLAQADIATETLRTGDHVVITGAPMRDPNLRVLSLLSEIRRPSDGWRWGRERPLPEACAAD